MYNKANVQCKKANVDAPPKSDNIDKPLARVIKT